MNLLLIAIIIIVISQTIYVYSKYNKKKINEKSLETRLIINIRLIILLIYSLIGMNYFNNFNKIILLVIAIILLFIVEYTIKRILGVGTNR